MSLSHFLGLMESLSSEACMSRGGSPGQAEGASVVVTHFLKTSKGHPLSTDRTNAPPPWKEPFP